MRLLLDTHIWLWSLLDRTRLSRRTARHLGRPDVETWISPITICEILTLVDKGRLSLEPNAPDWISAARKRSPVRDASLTLEVAAELPNVLLRHRDPADRLIAATARAYDLTLVTADENLLRGRGFQVLANE